MTTYSVSHAAYLKLILHAAKYPHKVVNGGMFIKTSSLSYPRGPITPSFRFA
jgi:hypothetical protein